MNDIAMEDGEVSVGRDPLDGVRVKFWSCPNDGWPYLRPWHRVKWDGDLATCLSCGENNRPRPCQCDFDSSFTGGLCDVCGLPDPIVGLSEQAPLATATPGSRPTSPPLQSDGSEVAP